MKAFLRMRTYPGLLCTFIAICFAATASFSATFPGSGLGQIPDSPAGGNLCGDFSGPPLNVTFAVSGLNAPLTDVRVGFTSSGLAHSWVGDLTVTLRAPADAAVKTIFGGTGATLATDCGDNSDVAGPYSFFDSAPPTPTWWQAATTAGAAVPVAEGNYQATVPAPGGGANTPITPTFAGLTTGQINGTWTLRFHDGGQGDTGAISAASLTFTAGSDPVQHVVDMDGDGKTDWCVVRNYEAPSPIGRIIWITRHAAGTDQIDKLGIATDFFLPADYNGDGKTDVAVWRPGAPGVAAWYILQSGVTVTLRSETFGQSGDDPSVVGDYDGDGKDDLAVYRPGANSGDPSFWYWRQTNNGVLFNRQWGQQGDFPAPGDYDGDGKNDFVVQRNAGGGQARFWRLFATGSTDSVIFGTPTDVIVPGDYDGDSKTDIALTRAIGPDLVWFVLPSSGGVYTQTVFGLFASDYQVQGDYDGDGKTDIAVWRPGAPDPTYFYVNKSTGGLLTFEWGQGPNPIVGDYPVANYNTH